MVSPQNEEDRPNPDSETPQDSAESAVHFEKASGQEPAGAETQPVVTNQPSAGAEAYPEPPGVLEGRPAKGRRARLPMITLVGLVALLVVAATSAFGGYQSGINLRKSAEATQVAGQVQRQFELAVLDMQDGAYDRARQRFEWVINNDPNYPGLTEKLAEVYLFLNGTATPTPVPTPTVTPTPDNRSVDEQTQSLFSAGEQALMNGDWTGTIDTLLKLRKLDPNYRAVDIDGMLYLALRNRGKDKIGREADLEGGIYDLSLAERFGPLDTEAQGFLNWARLYITGASFWELNWEQAVAYFEQIAPQLPNLRDGTGLTAMERYRQSLIGYGRQLLAGEDPCAAQEKLELALSIAPDPDAEAALEEAIQYCSGLSDEEPPAEEPPAEEAPPAETPVSPEETPVASPEATPYP